jgi:subtilisin-like proprotein convertase family protein
MSGAISKLAVRLNGLTHTHPADLDILLESPTGQKVMLMSDRGGGKNVSGITLTFDAKARVAVPAKAALTTGTFRPANSGKTNDVFAAPAPVRPYSKVLEAFNGASSNGTWKLFVRDDAVGGVGTIVNGFSLIITTQQ